MEPMDLCLFADEYDIATSELNNKQQEMEELQEVVKGLRNAVAMLQGDVQVQIRLWVEDHENHSTQREWQMFGPHWRGAACRASPVEVDKSVDMVALVVDRKRRDVAVQAAVPLLVITSSMPTNRQFVVAATTRPSYALAATKVTLMPTGLRNETNGGPVPSAGGVGPQPVGAYALLQQGVPTCVSVDQIFWEADKLKLGVGELAVKPRGLVGLDSRGSNTASCLVLYFSRVVPVCGRALRFGDSWCRIDCDEFASRSVPSAYACDSRW